MINASLRRPFPLIRDRLGRAASFGRRLVSYSVLLIFYERPSSKLLRRPKQGRIFLRPLSDGATMKGKGTDRSPAFRPRFRRYRFLTEFEGSCVGGEDSTVRLLVFYFFADIIGMSNTIVAGGRGAPPEARIRVRRGCGLDSNASTIRSKRVVC